MRKDYIHQAYRRPCASLWCPQLTNRSDGLCVTCFNRYHALRMPVAGFISSLDLRHVANIIIKEQGFTYSDQQAALRAIRGSRYPTGPWDDRPSYRLTPLLHGKGKLVKLPHLLVGRRRNPSIESLVMALVHYHLCDRVMGITGSYRWFLTGATYYQRRGVSAPKGSEVLTGGAGHTGYLLHTSDFVYIGMEVIKACSQLGINPRSRQLSDRITQFYHEGLAAGTYHRQLLCTPWARRTQAMGDHPLSTRIQFKYSPHWGHIRLPTGYLQGPDKRYPHDLDETPQDRAEVLHRHKVHLAAKADIFKVQTSTIQPPTDWLFH
ncbi:hypothetical protein SAMN05421665_1232 [Yoonia rosea]|uniref:Uncharacterized protein n=1 Tax=Yoonia rosea TaxID=287098 RepID=A0A1R3WTE1_9RHOB|nr:hypothetical protein [Yoonia rosea]SIT81198.1 hypothetical protein SAMN05421665_1232 [Yoonia rosea]